MDPDTVLYLIQDAILGVMVVFLLAITVVGMMSYRRTRARKILYVTAGLGTLTAKAVMITVMLYLGHLDATGLGVVFLDAILVMDSIAALCLYIAIFRY